MPSPIAVAEKQKRSEVPMMPVDASQQEHSHFRETFTAEKIFISLPVKPPSMST
jgi:hypothetical protein